MENKGKITILTVICLILVVLALVLIFVIVKNNQEQTTIDNSNNTTVNGGESINDTNEINASDIFDEEDVNNNLPEVTPKTNAELAKDAFENSLKEDGEVKDYKVTKCEITSSMDNLLACSITFDVQTTSQYSMYNAGNGTEKEDNWIVDKQMNIIFEKNDDKFVIIKRATSKLDAREQFVKDLFVAELKDNAEVVDYVISDCQFISQKDTTVVCKVTFDVQTTSRYSSLNTGNGVESDNNWILRKVLYVQAGLENGKYVIQETATSPINL